jgi:hypothetical protein
MNNMEHLDKKWKIIGKGLFNEPFFIVTDEPECWYIAEVRMFFEGDRNGLKAARHICDLHNATVK